MSSWGSNSVPHPRQFNISVPHKRTTPFQPPKSLSSTHPSVPHQKTPHFHTKNPSVPPPPLSFTPKTPQFNTKNLSVPHISQFLTKNPSVPPPPPLVSHQKPLSSTSSQFHTKNSSVLHQKPSVPYLNPSVQHTPQLCFCLRSFWCGTEGKVELRDFGCWRGVVLVWNRCVEVRGSVWNWGVLSSWLKIWNEAYDFEWFSMNSNYESFTIMVFN